MSPQRSSALVRNVTLVVVVVVLGAMVSRALWRMRESFAGTAGTAATAASTSAAATLSPAGRDATCAALAGQIAQMPGTCNFGVVRDPATGRNTLVGDTTISGSANVQNRLHFGDRAMNPRGDWATNDSDSYYLEKVRAGTNTNALRLTLKDDADESLQIWGGTCAAGDCAGQGRQQHRFDAGGRAWHASSVCVDRTCLSAADVARVKAGLSAPAVRPGAAGKECVELGQGVRGKETNAGKLCYARWSDALDIVGAGRTFPGRKVRVHDQLETQEVRATRFRTAGGSMSLNGDCITWPTRRGEQSMCFRPTGNVEVIRAGQGVVWSSGTDK